MCSSISTAHSLGASWWPEWNLLFHFLARPVPDRALPACGWFRLLPRFAVAASTARRLSDRRKPTGVIGPSTASVRDIGKDGCQLGAISASRPRLSVETRRQIVQKLDNDGHTQTQIAEMLGVSKQIMSDDVRNLDRAEPRGSNSRLIISVPQ
jgi:Homeodomain-like domain